MYRVIWWAIHPHSQLLSSLCTVCASPYMHAAMIGVPLQNKCAIQDSNARKVRINTPYFRFSLRGYQTESRMLLGLWATILQRSLTPTSKLVLLTYELWKISLTISHTVILFACLIIHTFQLVFSARTVFFSHNKSANSTFSHDFSAKRTGSMIKEAWRPAHQNGRKTTNSQDWWRKPQTQLMVASGHFLADLGDRGLALLMHN
jgi:hypothetical protein